MSKLETTMCRLSKDDIKVKEQPILKELTNARYYCKKCLRVAQDKSILCKPVKL